MGVPFSTLLPPPLVSDQPNTGYRFDGTEWQCVPDHRTTTFYDVETKEEIHLAFGQAIPTNATHLVPPDADYTWQDDSGLVDGGIWVLSLDALKARKLKQIKESWQQADSGPCHTGIMVAAPDSEEIELVIQYAFKDRDMWIKKPLGVALELVRAGRIEVTPEEAKALSRGSASDRIFDAIDSVIVVVKDYYNNYLPITVNQMYQAALAQNMTMQQDLYHKWALEAEVERAITPEQVLYIHWGMSLDE